MASDKTSKSSVVIVAQAVLLLLGSSLLGCPRSDQDCSDGRGCASVESPACSRPEQCLIAETCTPDFVCRPGSCDFYGCVDGFTCGVVDGAHACVPSAGSAGVGAMAAPDRADAASIRDDSPKNPSISHEAGVQPGDAGALSDAAADASP